MHCKFAIRGGGHMWWAGAANIQDGVTIDLSSLNETRLSSDRKILALGAGTRWIDAYRVLDPMGLSITGGRVWKVGVWGDLRLVVVLASGEIVNANISSNPRLFKALKGGGNNFGVITRFDFKTFEQGAIWGGFVISPWNSSVQLNQQLQALEKFGNDSERGLDDYSTVENVYVFGPSGPSQIANILVNTNAVARPPILADFTDVKAQTTNTVGMTNISSLALQTGTGPGIENGGRYIWASATYPNNATTLAKIVSLCQESFYGHGKPPTYPGFSLHPVNKSQQNTVWMNFAVTSTGADADEAIVNATETFLRKAREYCQEQNQYEPFVYSNYALPSQDAVASYGTENQAFLRAVAREYDPQEVFQKLVPGGFKLYRRGKTCC
ncbi:uncharacterized protein KY384_006765 [Bacidia gigantensis]|uniref:uncharacterized protein n=1 Tax=Bacidia gigantensis TaxID=2732470 RepID=UPI001D038730|nr:uncharacterized protein KY384_006765 [Bacidia gigantensis]KAG8527849.1 hypothetical protein KY384_006765 [Bacidia gigantensis]